LRRLLSRGAQLIGLVILPEVLGRVSDPMSGYFMLRRSAIADKLLRPLGYKILIEVLARGTIRWTSEVGYVFREREAGESKVRARVYLDYLWHLLKLRLTLLRESRLLRFCVVGASGVMVDMGLFYLLGDPRALGWNVSLAKALAAESALVSNFLLNDAWTFREQAARRPDLPARLRRFLGFNAICGIGIGLNLLIIHLLWGRLGLNRYVANAIAILLVTAWNYLLNAKLNWSPLRVPAEERDR
jgi:dolichol-phosphate mannosyltransferase